MSQPLVRAGFSYDVVIVGGGLVGATLAALLADSALSVAVVEARAPNIAFPASEAPFEPRVSALTVAAKRLLQHTRVWDSVERARHSPFQKMHVWDADGTGEITFSCDDLGVPALGYIIENSIVIAALYQRLAKAENIHLFPPRKLLPVGETRMDVTG